MKKCLLILLLNLVSLYVTAQVFDIHWPQDGDRVVKTQYEFVAVEADSAVWDFSHAVETGREHAMRWLNLGDTVLVRVEQGNQFTYRMQGDTLLWLGYENPLLGMRDSIAPVAKMPMMTLGDSVATPYYFHGKYSGNHAVDLTGIHVVQLKALGTLILPTDTIHDALLVREVTDGKVRVSPELTDMPISADNDSLMRHVEVIDRWFSPTHRYAVAENVTNTFYVLGERRQQIHATYLCSPDVQELALGDVTTPRQNAPRHSQGAPSDNGNGMGFGNNLPLGDRLAVNVGDGQVTITVSGTDGTDVAVILSDIQGRVWASRSGKTQGGVWQGTVDTGHLSTGDYLLHVASGEETEVERIIVR
jgi:hypothetical protein